MALSREQMLEKVKEVLEKDLTASDLKISLFISAAQCYKKDFLLNPFPNHYLEQEVKNFDKLVSFYFMTIVAKLIYNNSFSVGRSRGNS
jgi:hypothetical protein